MNGSGASENAGFIQGMPEVSGYPKLFVSRGDGTIIHSREPAEFVRGGYDAGLILDFIRRRGEPTGGSQMRRKSVEHVRPDVAASLQDWHRALVSRRAFMLGLAGGSLAALFGISTAAGDASDIDEVHAWRIIDVVQQHLFPPESDSPGAKQINALEYLRFVVQDPKVDAEERKFIIRGAGWLEGMAREMNQRTFTDLDEAQRERVLRRIAASQVGENWLSTLILYLMEALLTDPAYGGNPGGIGWRWLQHVPGYPRPPKDKVYPELLG